jgi:hypothetical protein
MRLGEITTQVSRLKEKEIEAAEKSLNDALTCSRVVAHSPVKVRMPGSTTSA